MVVIAAPNYWELGIGPRALHRLFLFSSPIKPMKNVWIIVSILQIKYIYI